MRREFIQTVAVIAIAFGAGFFALGRHLDPPMDANNPVAMQRAINADRDVRGFAAVACGIGVCLMTFGALSLAVPWVNASLAKRHDSALAPPV
jgi:hypothetical protein